MPESTHTHTYFTKSPIGHLTSCHIKQADVWFLLLCAQCFWEWCSNDQPCHCSSSRCGCLSCCQPVLCRWGWWCCQLQWTAPCCPILSSLVLGRHQKNIKHKQFASAGLRVHWKLSMRPKRGLPMTDMAMKCDVCGVVLTWHSYKPWSDTSTGLMLSFQSGDSLSWNTLMRWLVV